MVDFINSFAKGFFGRGTDILAERRQARAENDQKRIDRMADFEDFVKKEELQQKGRMALKGLELDIDTAKERAKKKPLHDSAINVIMQEQNKSEDEARQYIRDYYGDSGEVYFKAYTDNRLIDDNANAGLGANAEVGDEYVEEDVRNFPGGTKALARAKEESAKTPFDYVTFRGDQLKDYENERTYGPLYPDVERSLVGTRQKDYINTGVRLGQKFGEKLYKAGLGESRARERAELIDRSYVTALAPAGNQSEENAQLLVDGKVNPNYKFAAPEEVRERAAFELFSAIKEPGIRALFPDGDRRAPQEQVLIDLATKYMDKQGLNVSQEAPEPVSAVPAEEITPEMADAAALPSELPNSPPPTEGSNPAFWVSYAKANPKELVNKDLDITSFPAKERTQIQESVAGYLIERIKAGDSPEEINAIARKFGFSD